MEYRRLDLSRDARKRLEKLEAIEAPGLHVRLNASLNLILGGLFFQEAATKASRRPARQSVAVSAKTRKWKKTDRSVAITALPATPCTET